MRAPNTSSATLNHAGPWLLVICAALAGLSCGKKSKGGDLNRDALEGKAEDPLIPEEVAPLIEAEAFDAQPGLLLSDQAQVQTRGVLSIVRTAFAEGEDEFELVNQSTGVVLVRQGQSASAGVTVRRYEKAVIVDISMTAATASGSFLYGANVVKVTAEGEDTDDEFPSRQIILTDFSAFGPGVMSFSTNQQVSDDGHQGWTSVMDPPFAYAADGSTLTTNIQDIINR